MHSQSQSVVLWDKIALVEMDWIDTRQWQGLQSMFWLSSPSLDIIKANFERSATLEPFKGKIKIW